MCACVAWSVVNEGVRGGDARSRQDSGAREGRLLLGRLCVPGLECAERAAGPGRGFRLGY